MNSKNKARLVIMGLSIGAVAARSSTLSAAITASYEDDSRAHPDSRRMSSDRNHAYNRNKKKR